MGDGGFGGGMGRMGRCSDGMQHRNVQLTQHALIYGVGALVQCEQRSCSGFRILS
jgi:hypothetical protein